MSDKPHPIVPSAVKTAGQSPSTRSTRAKPDPVRSTSAKPSSRKPRSPRASKPPKPEIDVLADALEAARTRRDELLESVAAAEKRLAELHREATSASETFDEAGRLMATARADAAAIRRSVVEAHTAAQAARNEARAALTVAESTRQELDAIEGRASVTEDARESPAAMTRDASRDSSGNAAGVRVAPVDAVTLPIQLPEVELVPPAERAGDARDRLVRYLSDARAVEREQAGLLQTLMDETRDADLRTELEQHRTVSEEQKKAVEARVKALGAEPSSGRGLLSLIVSRVWEVIQKPRDSADDAVETTLKALGVAELEAGMYLAVHALARAIDDRDTAELAAAHLRQERAFADRLRSRIAPAAARAARGGDTG